MRGSEAEALGEAGADLTHEVTGWVEGVHRAVAARVFRATGPLARPVQVAHDAISTGVYGAVRAAASTGARVAGRVAGARLGEERPGLSESRRGDLVVGAVNGVIGDRLERDGNGLAIELSWRLHGRDVSATDLAGSVDDPSGDVAVFVHGLCETEASWCWRAERLTGSVEVGHPSRLADELGFTPVLVRYNTGRHVSENGADLHRAIGELVAAWPVEVERVALIGHSMGGLVSRAAAAAGAAAGARWAELLSDVVCLGTPHLGAPLERVANAGAWALSLVAESAPFSDLLNTRSAGIKDLRYGYTRDDEWRDHDPDELLVQRRAADTPLDGVRYHAVAATLGQRDAGLAAEILGDLLVPVSSATGRARRGHPVEHHGSTHLPGVGHLDLLSHPLVTDRIIEALRP